MSQTDSRRIYRATTDSDLTDLPRAQLTSGMQILFVPILVGMEALTGGGVKNLDGISTLLLPLPTIFDVLNGDSFSRWMLRAKGLGEFTTPGADSDKLLVEPSDDDTLIWARILGSGGSSEGALIVDGSGNQIVDGDGNRETSP